MIRQGKDIEKLKIIMRMLARKESLEPRHRDHKLTGSYISHRECHVEPDWLLVYRVDIKEQTITFVGPAATLGFSGNNIALRNKMELRYNSFGQYMKKQFSTNVYKVNIDAGFTCPNRDGSLGFARLHLLQQ